MTSQWSPVLIGSVTPKVCLFLGKGWSSAGTKVVVRTASALCR